MKAEETHYLDIPCLRAKPDNGFRPAIWESMLGTVNAMNDAGDVQYFDYKYKAAKKFAGLDKRRELRVWRITPEMGNLRWDNGKEDYVSPRVGKLVLWIRTLRACKIKSDTPYRFGSGARRTELTNGVVIETKRDRKTGNYLTTVQRAGVTIDGGRSESWGATAHHRLLEAELAKIPDLKIK